MNKMFGRTLLAAATGALVVAYFPACWSKPLGTVKQMDEMIKKELPIGAGKDRVLEFLDSKKIEHSDYIDYKNQKLIMAAVRNTSTGFFATASIHVTFYFDEYGKLVKYNVEEVFTGP